MKDQLLDLIDSMNQTQISSLLKSAESLMLFATIEVAPESTETWPHAECLRRMHQLLSANPSTQGVLGEALLVMAGTAPSLLDQVKDVYAEGLRAGMALGKRSAL